MINSTSVVPVNPRGESPLTREQLWKGPVLKARDARLFLPQGACTRCEVIVDATSYLIREATIFRDEPRFGNQGQPAGDGPSAPMLSACKVRLLRSRGVINRGIHARAGLSALSRAEGACTHQGARRFLLQWNGATLQCHVVSSAGGNSRLSKYRCKLHRTAGFLVP